MNLWSSLCIIIVIIFFGSNFCALHIQIIFQTCMILSLLELKVPFTTTFSILKMTP